MEIYELEALLPQRLDALGPAPRAELLHVFMLPDLDRVDAIGSYWGNPATRAFGEPRFANTSFELEVGVVPGAIGKRDDETPAAGVPLRRLPLIEVSVGQCHIRDAAAGVTVGSSAPIGSRDVQFTGTETGDPAARMARP